jgi:hypothetical protein
MKQAVAIEYEMVDWNFKCTYEYNNLLSSGIYIQKNLPVDEGCSVGPDEADGEEGNERVTEKGEKVVADALKQQPDHGHACKDAPRCLFVPPQHKIGNWKKMNRL